LPSLFLKSFYVFGREIARIYVQFDNQFHSFSLFPSIVESYPARKPANCCRDSCGQACLKSEYKPVSDPEQEIGDPESFVYHRASCLCGQRDCERERLYGLIVAKTPYKSFGCSGELDRLAI
jgi:hypothetical protein